MYKQRLGENRTPGFKSKLVYYLNWTMDDELRSKIEDIVEQKVEQSLETDTDSEISKLVEQKVDEKLQQKEKTAERGINLLENGKVDRRSFLKMLGLGTGALGLASSGAAASLLSGTTIGGNTAFHTGNDGPGSNLDADTLDGKQASELSASKDPSIATTVGTAGTVYISAGGSLYMRYSKTNTFTYYNINPDATINLPTTVRLTKAYANAHITGKNNNPQEFQVNGNGNTRLGPTSTGSTDFGIVTYTNQVSHTFTDVARGSITGVTYVTLNEQFDGINVYTLKLYDKVYRTTQLTLSVS